MNKEQLYAAQTAMIEWLSDSHELGKKPFKIECAGEFDFNEMHYYIFRFKASLLGKSNNFSTKEIRRLWSGISKMK